MTKINGSQNQYELLKLKSSDDTKTEARSQVDSTANFMTSARGVERRSSSQGAKDIDGVLNALDSKSATGSDKTSSVSGKAGEWQSRIDNAKSNEEKRAIAKEMLKEGDSQIADANAQSQECQNQINQTKADMAVAQQQSKESVKQTQIIKTRITSLNQRKESMLRDVKTASMEIQREQQKMQQKEEKIKQLQQEAESLKNSKDPSAQARLREISGEIRCLTADITASSAKLRSRHSKLSQTNRALMQNAKEEATYTKQMNALSKQYETSNMKIQDFAQKLGEFSSKIVNLGNATMQIGGTMQNIGRALMAACTVSAIFTFGATAAGIPEAQQLVQLGGQVKNVGDMVAKVGNVGVQAANATLAVTNPAGVNISKLMAAATSAIGSCQGISTASTNANKELDSMLNTINSFDEKANEFAEIEKSVAQLFSGDENGEDNGQKMGLV